MEVFPPNVTSGSWDITVTATNSAHMHSAVAHVSLTAQPDFKIIVTPPATPITAGQSGVYTVSIGAVNGFDSSTSVNLSISSLPNGASAAPTSLTLPADGSPRTFTVFTSTSTISGGFYVYGSGGGKGHGIWPSLNMQTNPAGTYTISGQVRQPNDSGIGGTTSRCAIRRTLWWPLPGVMPTATILFRSHRGSTRSRHVALRAFQPSFDRLRSHTTRVVGSAPPYNYDDCKSRPGSSAGRASKFSESRDRKYDGYSLVFPESRDGCE